ncbi:MAG: methionine--tRNA ligase subunit beta [Candidatus Brocadiaceae bacterium]|jgi:methionyl-tRNA synthetase
MITIQDFKKVEMKAGKVVSVDEHPNADKLLILRADLGEERPRTLVAGLKDYYSAEELEGKNIVVVTNLEPVQLRGVRSEGMLLAAQEGDKVVLLTLDQDIAPGSPVL